MSEVLRTFALVHFSPDVIAAAFLSPALLAQDVFARARAFHVHGLELVRVIELAVFEVHDAVAAEGAEELDVELVDAIGDLRGHLGRVLDMGVIFGVRALAAESWPMSSWLMNLLEGSRRFIWTGCGAR